MPPSRLIVRLMIAALAALLLVPRAAWAQPGVQSSAQAIEADAAQYARMFDVPVSEALRRLEAQEASVPLVDRLVAAYRDRLAGIVIEHRPDYRIVLVLTGPATTETTIATAPLGVPVMVRTGALATRAQVLDAIERHQADLRAALPSPPGLAVDPRTGALLVNLRDGDLDDGDNAATAARLAAIAGVPVEVVTWGGVGEDLAVEGGGRVVGADADGGGRFVCTSGFVVTDGTRTALSTAAHCPDTLSFIDRAGVSTPLAMIGAWGARRQDVQLHDAGQPLQPLFRADGSQTARTVATWRNRASTRAGDFVCHRGERTGYSCTLVRYPDYAPPGDLCAGPCPASWVAAAGPSCKGGDSGGPVFLGTVAFGLVKGQSSSAGTCALYYYMSIDELPPGWTVLHGTPLSPPPEPAAPTPPIQPIAP